ncbi:MAG: protoporphyrinogen oxidase [Acidimicrobiales bacterium]
MARASVVVVGAGVAGLAAAWELSQGPEAPRVEVIESAERVGGSLATTTFAGRVIDLGADGFLARRPEATALVTELGLAERLEAVAESGASLRLRGALYEIPTGLALGVPTSRDAVRAVAGLSRRARWAAWRDEHWPRSLTVGEDATIGEIVRTKLGDEIAYQFVEPMVGGIQAGRIDELSARSVFPALYDAARRGGSLMRALRPAGAVSPGPAAPVAGDGPMFSTLVGGVGSLPVELARRLEERGVVVRTGVAVTALRRSGAGDYPWEVDTASTTTPADAIVLAVPAPVAGHLLGELDPALGALREVTSAGAALVTLSYSRDDVTLPTHGSGVLVPLGTTWRGEGSLLVTAVTFLDRKWPHLRRDDDVLVRAHVGRSDDHRWTRLSDEELVARVASELAVVLARAGAPRATLVQRWPQGLPQYRRGHGQLVDAARAAATPLAVALCGSAYDGVGVPASIGSGRRAGRQALATLDSPRSAQR